MRSKLIIGSSGQVAEGLKNEFSRSGVPFWSTTSKSQGRYYLDLSNEHSIKDLFAEFARENPDGGSEVYLPGAWTYVDGCESDPQKCRKINVEGPALVAEECARRSYKLAFYSTEYVFGGAEYEGGAVGPFTENDTPFPTSEYGRSKLEAEKIISSLSPRFLPLIVRTTMVFSWAPQGMNFFMQLFRHLENASVGKMDKKFRVPVDQISTPTYAPALSSATVNLMKQGAKGVVNIVGSDLLSRKEFVEEIVRAFSFDSSLVETAFEYLKTKELGQPARRPLTAGLSCEKLQKLGIEAWSLAQAFQDIARIRNS